MKCFQKSLSLLSAGVLLTSALAGSIFAANFSDADRITHDTAVEELVELGIINGRDDGRFDPQGGLSRAEMAKMAAVILDAGGASGGTGASYTDARNHWAEAYISQCAAQGLISGRGDGTFGPNDVLTGSAAAKILLTMLGYQADREGLVGADWQKHTDSLANQVGLYDELEGLDTASPLSRDAAAQMIFNGLNANRISYAGSVAQEGDTTLWQWAFSEQDSGTTEPVVLEGAVADLFARLEPYTFLFSPQDGAGSTELCFDTDGTFYGEYHASENGGKLLKESVFSGVTADVKKVDDYTYSLRLTELWMASEAGESTEEDGIQYLAVKPAGIEEGAFYYLYLPGHPVETLPASYRQRISGLNGAQKMPQYGLYQAEGEGSFIAQLTEN